jgi:hypothetical protein
MAYKAIRDKIIQVVQGVQQSGSSAYVEVAGTIKEQFSGYPAATVVPSAVTSEYLTQAENMRAYGINVYIHCPIASESDWGDVFDETLDLVDATMDALDQTIDLDGVCDFLSAVPLGWDVAQTGQQLELVATLQIVANKRVNVQ